MAKKNKELNFDEVIFDEAAKDKDLEHLELPLSRRIFWGVGIAAILLMLISLGRIFYINVTRGEFYMQRAGINANKEIVIPAPRGIITDRFGEPLVGNASVLSVFVDVGALFKEYNRDKIVGVAKELAEILSLDQSDIEQMLSEVNLERNNFVLVRRDVSVAEGIAIRSLNSPFVKLINDYARLYIDGPIFSHIVGYTGFADSGNEIVGKAGLEDYYDWRLSGREGSSILYRDTYGNILEDRIVNEPVAGEQLVTAIDADLQRYFYNSLKLGLRRLGRDAGVGIAINPQSGEILALVSMPSYDNNLLISRGNDDVKKAILNSSRQPLFNRAIAGTYSPGSTIKPLVALAALKDGVIDPAHQIFSAGFIEIPNLYFPNQPSRFLDWKAHGWVDLRSALARSSNIYFYAVGGGLDDIKGLGIEKLKYYWQYFGFGKIMGVDMANESSGYLPDPQKKENNSSDIWRIGDTYNISIGQGDLSVSPLQLISFIASIANGG
ncbi:MAG: penicillin-binding transpeptidase domain-containing protein, partial [bacterium]|nr:penicillin-binding transpeptidase domain-containing protein [bacterium]